MIRDKHALRHSLQCMKVTTVYSRRSFVSRFGLFCCTLPLTVFTQVRPSRVKRIGFLSGAVPTLITSFEEEMRRLGHRSGENIIVAKRIRGPNP